MNLKMSFRRISEIIWGMIIVLGAIYPGASAQEYQIPPYVDTTLFSEIELSLNGEYPLGVSMVVAKTSQPTAVVLLFNGFGFRDRDEAFGTIKPLRDIAWGLATRGIASIRFDSRSYALAADEVAGMNLDRYLMGDIAALLAYARMQPELFDTSRIYVAGYGLGGLVAPEVARRDSNLAGVILLSAAARPPHEILADALGRYASTSDSTTTGPDSGRAEALAVLKQLSERSLPSDQLVLFAAAQVWYDLMDAGGVRSAQNLGCPILVIQGGRDVETIDKDFALWKEALDRRDKVTFKKYGNLNHFYQPGWGTATEADYVTNASSVDRRVIDDIAAWIKSR